MSQFIPETCQMYIGYLSKGRLNTTGAKYLPCNSIRIYEVRALLINKKNEKLQLLGTKIIYLVNTYLF